MTALKTVVSVCVVVGFLAGTAVAVTIATVPVGDPGNTADTASHSGYSAGQGSVAYSYNIGMYEVSAGQYAAFLNAKAATDTYGLYNADMSRTDYGSGITQSGSSGNYTYSVDPAFVNRPVNFVSYWDACRFSNWLNNGQGNGDTETGAYTLTPTGIANNTVTRNANWKWAVTSEDEWYKAAYYKAGSTNAGYWDYPTRSNTAPGNDMADPSGNNANIKTNVGSIQPIQSPYYTTVGGEFQNSASPYGTFDQGGNVWEWNEAVRYGPYRGFRGGAFNYGYAYIPSSFHHYGNPPYEIGNLGFRVSQVPESATLVMLALAGMGLRRRGHRGAAWPPAYWGASSQPRSRRRAF